MLNVLEEELPCVRYDGWGNLTPSGYFKFDLGVYVRACVRALLYVSLNNRCRGRSIAAGRLENMMLE